MRIVIIRDSSLADWNEKNGTDLAFGELSDAQVEEINQDYDDGWSFDSWEEYVAMFNMDDNSCPEPSSQFIRVIGDRPDPIRSSGIPSAGEGSLRFNQLVNEGCHFIRRWLLARGGFADFQLQDGEEREGLTGDKPYGIFFHEGEDVQKEVRIKALKLDRCGCVLAFCGLVEAGDVAFSREEMEERLDREDRQDDCGFWELLTGGNLWATPTVESILEAIEN